VTATVAPDRNGRVALLAVAVCFFTNGATFASWLARLPEIQAEVGMSDSLLGLTLVGGSVGGFAASVGTGWLVHHWGSRRTLLAGGLALSLLLPLVAVAASAFTLFVTLVLLGVADAVTDVSCNDQAVLVQEGRQGSVLTRLHACWSIGTLTGGVAAGVSGAAGVDFRTQLLVTSLVLVALFLWARTRLYDDAHYAATRSAAGGRVRVGASLTMVLMACGALAVLAELPATEWATLVMIERHGLSDSAAVWGFVGFAAGMVVGRLLWDRPLDRLGSRRAQSVGAVMSLAGLAIATTGVQPWITVVGFFVAAAGCSVFFPLMVRRASASAAGAVGVGVMAAGSRLGTLTGSPAMGALSDAWTRSAALLAISGTAALLLLFVRIPVRRAT
jgi:predicted MFS family arabinose efflux permease